MIAFEVSLNGKVVSTAGVKDFGVLTAILSWVRRRSDKARDGKTIEEELTFEVGGLDSHNPDLSEHLKWLSKALHVGDVVSIHIVDRDAVNLPKSRKRDDPKKIAKAKRRYYERLKRELEKYG
jgi:hypothetical protein